MLVDGADVTPLEPSENVQHDLRAPCIQVYPLEDDEG